MRGEARRWFFFRLKKKNSGDPKYPLLSKEGKTALHRKYSNNRNVSYVEPIRINRLNCNDDRFNNLKRLMAENILMVFEEPNVEDMEKKLPSNKVSRLNEERWRERDIKALHLIQPPQKEGTFQVYQVADASEVHYECLGLEITTAIECAGIECFFYPNDKCCRSSYCWVNNSQNDLSNHFKEIDHLELDALIRKYASAELSSDGRNKRSRKQATSFGVCCKLRKTSIINWHYNILLFILHKT